MSSGPKNVTSTTTTEPPRYLQPMIEGAATAAGAAMGPTEFNFQNQTGLNSAQATGQGLGALFNRGQQGSGALDAANNLTQSTLQGDFLNSNPYLDQTFNRAADLTRGRLDTEFAGGGRNLGAARPARSEELQTLASNIYGGNYQAERDRQQGAVGQVGGLQSADFQNIQAQIDAGNFPLDQYINRLGGIIPGAGGVTNATQPVFRTGLF